MEKTLDTEKKGFVHIYCGDGKGKTSAAVGLGVRMAGNGNGVVAARFLKTEDSGEVRALRQMEGVQVIPCAESFGFTWQMTEEQRQRASACCEGLLAEAGKLSFAGAAERRTLLILDEVCAALNSGLLQLQSVLELLDARPDCLEVAMTGRDPAPELLERADYITELKKIRHPFDWGVKARKGIEY